jgi:hypothetical protein
MEEGNPGNYDGFQSASTEISTILLRAVGLVGPRKNLAGNTIANDNAIALAA